MISESWHGVLRVIEQCAAPGIAAQQIERL